MNILVWRGQCARCGRPADFPNTMDLYIDLGLGYGPSEPKLELICKNAQLCAEWRAAHA